MNTTVYSGRVTNWPLVWVMNVLAVGLVVGGFVPGARIWPLVVAAVVIILANLMISSVRTTAGPQGVTVHYGVLGRPRFHYDRNRIASAEAVDVSFFGMGGWGVHWSPWRGLRLTIRSGPALRLVLHNGAKVTISADHPAAAVAALTGRTPTPVEW